MTVSEEMTPPPVTRVGQRFLVIALAVWVAALTGGFFALWRYKAAATDADAEPSARWPADSTLRPAAGRATLVLFAHPRCPCTHASVTELARLVERTNGSLAVRVAVVRPADVPADWDDTELVARAGAIPGATVSWDDEGVEAARFGASASGHALVYDREGRRIFSGGLTSSRGHEGESFGSKRILSMLTTGVADRADAPVFGCALAVAAMPAEEDTR
jgi:hypothetical protein